MSRIWSRLKRPGWKWHIFLIVIVFVVAGVALPPSIYYLLRDRELPDYGNIVPEATMIYHVTYDSGEGTINESTFTLKVVDTNIEVNSIPCFYTVTEMDPHPVRKVNAPFVGTAEITLGTDEVWRSQNDLRILEKEKMLINLVIVNTAINKHTYTDYDNYPEWPYIKGDTWTYSMNIEPDTNLQPKYTDIYRAEVVADDEVVVVGDTEYRCFKVVHTLIDTNISVTSGGGLGSTSIEYWANSGRSVAPLKIEERVQYKGIETWTLVESDITPGSW